MKRSIVMLPSLWIKWYSIARLRDVIGKEILAISVIKNSPWAFGGYIDIYSHWHAARQSQPIQNIRVKQRLMNPPVNPWIDALSHLRHYFRFVVELWPVRTKLRTRGTSISFPSRPVLASCFRHVCHVIEQGVVPVCRYSQNFHICWGSSGTSFWLKMFLHFNVINYYRADTTSLSYFCLMTRHPLFKALDTPIFCWVEVRWNIM